MISFVKLALLYFFVILLQAKTPSNFLGTDLFFDLVLVVTVLYALNKGSQQGLYAGLVGGLLLSTLSSVSLAGVLIYYGMIGALAGRWQKVYDITSLQINIFMVAILSLFFASFYTVFMLFKIDGLFVFEGLRFVMTQTILNVLSVPVVLLVMRKVKMVSTAPPMIQTPYEIYVNQ